MLAEKQLVEWFRSNGIDIDVPFPAVLMGRLCRKAIRLDNALFVFLGKGFKSYNKNLLVLRYNSWNEVFSCYTLYGATSSVSEH